MATLIGIGLENHLQKYFLEKSNESKVQLEFSIFYQKRAKLAQPKKDDFVLTVFQTNQLCIVGELAEGGSEAAAVCIIYMRNLIRDTRHMHDFCVVDFYESFHIGAAKRFIVSCMQDFLLKSFLTGYLKKT